MKRPKLALALGATALAVTPMAAEAAKPPKVGGTLTLTGTPNPVTYGSEVTLSGKLSGAKAGQAVTLRSDPFPFDAFKPVASPTTNGSGAYQATLRPQVNTRYQATQGARASAVVTVLVRPRVSLRLSDSSPKRGQRVAFSGRVCPQHDGSTLLIQRHTSAGYRTVRAATLRDIPGSTCSRYTRTFRLYRDGRYHAAIARHADHFSGISAARAVDVHR
jgi:hypothetical protein